MKRTFAKAELLERGLPYENYDGEKNLFVESQITETTRWSVCYDLYFEYDGKFYGTWYSVGATEQQCEGPWEFDNVVDAYEVEQVEKTVKVWQEVKEENEDET